MPRQIYRRNLIIRALEKAWRFLREITGDADYENYLKHCAAKKSDPNPGTSAMMTRAEFYSDALKRKYSTINRCC